MIDWRRERFCWVPRESSGTLQGESIDVRAFTTYLTKHADRTGSVRVGQDIYRSLSLLCGPHIAERRAFAILVTRVASSRCVRVENGALRIVDYRVWQTTREPARRIYVNEPPAFSLLPLFTRVYAAELVRTAQDDGTVWCGTAEDFARHFAYVATAESSRAVKARHEARLLAALRGLLADRFLVNEGGSLRVRNFDVAQRRQPRAGVPMASAQGVEGVPMASAQGVEGVPMASAQSSQPVEITRLKSPANGFSLPSPALPSPALPSPHEPAHEPVHAVPAVAVTRKRVKRDAQTLSLFGDAAPSADGKRAEEAKRTKREQAEPLPFSVREALAAVAEASDGRFACGDAQNWPAGLVVNTNRRIRKVPRIEQWAAVGQWLAAGGDAFKGVVGISWAMGAQFDDALVRAESWVAAGRPDPNARFTPKRATFHEDVVTPQDVLVAVGPTGATVVSMSPLRATASAG